MNKSEFPALFEKAKAAGLAAGQAFVPSAVVFGEGSLFSPGFKPGAKLEVCNDGVCGFAWVVVSPGNCPFANWLKKNKFGRPGAFGGVMVRIGEFNQSMQKKSAAADAMAAVFKDAGIKARAEERMD